MFTEITDRAYDMTIKYNGNIDIANEWISSIKNNNHPTGGTLDDKMIQVRCDDKSTLVKRLYNVYVKGLIIGSEFEFMRRQSHIDEYNRIGHEYFSIHGEPMRRFSVHHGMPKPNINNYASDFYMEEYEGVNVFN